MNNKAKKKGPDATTKAADSALHAFFADAPSLVGPNDVQSEQE